MKPSTTSYPMISLLATMPETPSDYPHGNDAAAAYANAIRQWRFQACEVEGIRPDPAAVFAIAASLNEYVKKHDEIASDVSDAYSGGDQFMREIMSVGERFEAWACNHIDFSSLDNCWPYMLEEKFGDALQEATGAMLSLTDLGPADWEKIAGALGLTVQK